MSIVKIAWRSIQHRGVGSILSVLSMALGVMLVVAVLCIHGIVNKSFRSNSSFGYNIIVGAKGGSTQLTLNTVFYLSKPTGNIPYEYYMAFRNQEERKREFSNSIYKIHDEHLKVTQILSAQQSLSPGGHLNQLSQLWQHEALDQEFTYRAATHKRGLMARFCSMAIPLALGDYFGEEGAYFRVIGTTPEFFTELELDVDTGEKFKFADGRAFEFDNKKNRYFEAVMGSQVAKRSGTRIGDDIFPIHGDPTSDGAHTHEQGFRVVGILEPTGTPHDRAVFVNLEGFYLMEDHAKPITDDGHINEESDDDEDGEVDEFLKDDKAAVIKQRLQQISFRPRRANENDGEKKPDPHGLQPLPLEEREVTAILVRTKNDEFGLTKDIIIDAVNNNRLESTLNWSNYRPLKQNVNDAAEAANPIEEVTKLFYFFVDPIRKLLLSLTTLICVVSGISILVGIYNSMSERRNEIAVMRALGANRAQVMGITLVETIMLALAGGFIGWIAGHVLVWLAGKVIEGYTGLQVSLLSFTPTEFVLLPGLLILAVLVGIYPSISAYRTDVAKSLGA